MAFSRWIYKGCGGLAAAMLCFIAVLIILQIFLRAIGHQIPSADDFAAWALSASIFLALPSALIHGSHIRVTSLRGLIRDPFGRYMDIAASYRYNDVSHGLIAVPLWIPQIAMVLGSVLFKAAMAERAIRLFLGLPVEITTASTESTEV